MYYRSIFIAALIALPLSVSANPVSFKDGYGIMPTYTPDWSDYKINYSLAKDSAFGASIFYRNGDKHKATFNIMQYNYLFKRWNELDSQANIYGSIGVGTRDSEVAGYGALEADYETRRIYTLIAAENLQSANAVSFTQIKTRLGFSPYKASFDKLQTWLITEFDYMPEMKDELTVTPLVRLFYNNYAVELGSSLQGKFFLAGMIHF